MMPHHPRSLFDRSTLLFLALIGFSGLSAAGDHPVRGSLDIPVAAMNQLLDNACLLGEYPTEFSGSLDEDGLLRASLTVHQPSASDVAVFEGALHLDLHLRVSGSFTLQDRSQTIDRVMAVRFALKHNPSLTFADSAPQFLDHDVPRLLRDVVAKNLSDRLRQSGLAVSVRNVLAAIPTQVVLLSKNHLDYRIEMACPSVSIATFLPKPVPGFFKPTPHRLRLKIPLRLSLQFDGLGHDYRVELGPTFGFGGSGLDLDYSLTDEQVDLLVTQVDAFVDQLPKVLRERIANVLSARGFALYKGRIIDAANALVPTNVNVRLALAVLFEMPLALQQDLARSYRVNVENEFLSRGYMLTGEASLREVQAGVRWLINDGDAGFYEILKTSTALVVRRPSAIAGVSLRSDRIRVSFQANVRGTAPDIFVSTPATWGGKGQFRVCASVSGSVPYVDIANSAGVHIKSFPSSTLSTTSTRAVEVCGGRGDYSRLFIWDLTDDNGRVIGSGQYIIRAVIDTGHRLYPVTTTIGLVK